MDKYLDSFREMISLRGLTDHTLKSYCTYINAYLDYLTNILHKSPEDVSCVMKIYREKDTGWKMESHEDISSPNRGAMTDLLIPFFSQDISMPMKKDWGGNEGLPAILSAMLLAHICMKIVPTYLPLKLLWDINP